MQHRDPGRCEDMRRQVVLEIQHADEAGLLHQGQAEDRPGVLLTDVHIRRELVWGRGVIQHHTLLRAEDVVEDGLRYLRGRCSRLSETDLDPVTGSCGFRCDSQRVTSRKDQEPSLGAGMLDRDQHERIDQFFENNLTGYRL